MYNPIQKPFTTFFFFTFLEEFGIFYPSFPGQTNGIKCPPFSPEKGGKLMWRADFTRGQFIPTQGIINPSLGMYQEIHPNTRAIRIDILSSLPGKH